MTLAVIGAGFGRTGTLSLKRALEALGLGPCYHMIEVIAHPARMADWTRAAQGHAMDWDAVFEGYASAVDWPACDYWRELADAYPAAKVILTVRDAESWYASTQNTIFGPANAALAEKNPDFAPVIRAIADRHFGGSLSDRARLIAAFERHNQEVMRSLPAGRLLVYRVSEGWASLCAFLDVPVPAAPFPAENSTEEFRVRAAERAGH